MLGYKKIGIIGAMDQEVNGLKDIMANKQIKNKAGMEFVEGLIDGTACVVVKSGVGKVNAAVCAQVLADLFDVDVIINTGAAGALKAGMHIGDIVIATDAVQHDMNSVDFGFPLGQVPFMPFSYEADKELGEYAMKCSQETNPENRVMMGRVVSGDEFVARKERKEWIESNFQALCTEMEGAAIAQTAYLNNIPFLIIRAISDNADDEAGMSFDEFSKLASENGIKLLRAMLAN